MHRILHLGRRFFEFARARPLTPAEQAETAALLRPEEATAFWAQAPQDQRHAFTASRRARSMAPNRGDLERAALLHDVGKRHAPLRITGRILASLCELAGLSVPGRLGRYLDHCAVGGDDLAALGAEPLVVDFARHHHGARPVGITEGDWRVLLAADGEEKAL
jgi:hypothetical protein